MKILIRIIQAITALVLLFLSIGVFSGDVTYTNSITVNASPQKAYQIFTDSNNTEKWLTGFKSFENIKGEPLTEGSEWWVTIEQDGEVMKMKEVVTKVEPNKHFAFTLDNEMMTVDIAIDFVAQGNKTEINVNNRVSGKNILWRSMFVFMTSAMQSHSQKDYDKLAVIINEHE
ncbi:SRPBCC family protein [Pleionea sp. CnH1-48]|uniref:SRPBCC family protein n=1 Tax=Pleionea sp. CnH1-48 TaxID=2954494 RepID=UPI002096965D|nr:SRPBCC family protein [Pleionea sp. CnH1-48]MCO7224692.1 SRPBCC family protein [Pleionea sp. CnH1-48]